MLFMHVFDWFEKENIRSQGVLGSYYPIDLLIRCDISVQITNARSFVFQNRMYFIAPRLLCASA